MALAPPSGSIQSESPSSWDEGSEGDIEQSEKEGGGTYRQMSRVS